MFCTKCGKENKDDVNFCAYCGMAIGKEQAPTSSRGNATQCCICGKELSPSQVYFASNGSLKPFCVGCVCKSDDDVIMGWPNEPHWPQTEGVAAVSKTVPLKADKETYTNAETKARGEDQPEALGKPGQQKVPQSIVNFMLAARQTRDNITGEKTMTTKPMLDFMTEAELMKELEEFKVIIQKENKRLKRVLGQL